MHLITELFDIESMQILLSDNFKNNKNKWEEINIDSEKASIKDGYYYMDNTSKSSWNYYKNKAPFKKGQNFVVDSLITLEKKEDVYGHFGLIWGFDEERKYLNRFTLSADGKRVLVMHFEKDHHKIYHRFQNKKLPKFDMKKPIRFSIIKLGEYFYFFINKQKVYLAHESMFCANGFFVGYYIEPHLSIKSNFFEVKKINVRALEVQTGLQHLMNGKIQSNTAELDSENDIL